MHERKFIKNVKIRSTNWIILKYDFSEHEATYIRIEISLIHEKEE